MVVELAPDLKRNFYAELALEGLTFKDWLTREAQRYIVERRQPLLFAPATSGPAHDPREKP